MDRYVVMVTDTQTDVPADPHLTTPEVWFYEVDADTAEAAVPPAIEQRHTEVGERAAVSLAVKCDGG